MFIVAAAFCLYIDKLKIVHYGFNAFEVAAEGFRWPDSSDRDMTLGATFIATMLLSTQLSRRACYNVSAILFGEQNATDVILLRFEG